MKPMSGIIAVALALHLGSFALAATPALAQLSRVVAGTSAVVEGSTNAITGPRATNVVTTPHLDLPREAPLQLADPGIQSIAVNAATLYSWTPQWSPQGDIIEESRIDLVQGLPGYSLIAGKDTLVAFTPHPAGMKTGDEWSWLDVYRLHPWGAEFPELSYVGGTPVGDAQECHNQDGRCAEMNFPVSGEHLAEPGDYLFVVTWHDEADASRQTARVYQRFHEPAVIKVLFVPLEQDVFSLPGYREATMASIEHYFSRMPFATSAIDEEGPDQRYWDVYPAVIPVPNECWESGRVHADCYALIQATGDALEDYNSSAAVAADLAVGIIAAATSGVSGYAMGPVSVCRKDVGTCTHEIGHSLINHFDVADENSDDDASRYTCGYFTDENADSFDCQDWAWDPATEVVYDPTDQGPIPANLMAWSGIGENGFFTRHFYEGACNYLGGGCEAILSGDVHLEALGSDRYVDGDSQTDEVRLIAGEDSEPPRWNADIVEWWGGHTLVQLHVVGSCSGYCPSTMLIGNRVTGEVQTADPATFFHPSDPMNRGHWCANWLVEHVAAGIATLECYLGYSFLEWDDVEEGVALGEPAELDAEHWTASFQWRISKPKPYAGYPD